MNPTSFSKFNIEEIDFVVGALLEEGSSFTNLPTSQLLEQAPVTPNPHKKERNCFTCSRTATSHWYKDPSDTQKDLCSKCYQAQRRALSLTGALGRTCSTPSCQTTSTTQWHKDPSDTQKALCHRCYQAQKKALSLSGSLRRTCSVSSCQTTSTTRWYKDFSDKEKDLCEKCYNAQKQLFL